MIDVHCHILPNVDDGSKSNVVSRQLLLKAINEGITDICFTPHFSRIDNYVYKKKDLFYKFEQFKSLNSDLKINMYLGNELMINSDLDELLNHDELLTINNSKYILVEFPFDKYKEDYDEYLYNLTISGYKIIIAHPERYSYVLDDYKFVERWTKNDYYLQVNQSSFNDHKRKKLIFNLLEQGKVSLVASDAHNEHRSITLIDAYNLVSKKFNQELAELLFSTNPYNILNDLDVINPPTIKKHLL